jgi:hypothetical protein
MVGVELGLVGIHRFYYGKEARLAEASKRRELSFASLAQSDVVTKRRGWHKRMIAEKYRQRHRTRINPIAIKSAKLVT